jgi:hypothetical protein
MPQMQVGAAIFAYHLVVHLVDKVADVHSQPLSTFSRMHLLLPEKERMMAHQPAFHSRAPITL